MLLCLLLVRALTAALLNGTWLRDVLVAGDVVEPGHDLTVLIGVLHGDVSHVAVGRRAMPVLVATRWATTGGIEQFAVHTTESRRRLH